MRRDATKAEAVLELERARVRWFLSTDANDLPFSPTVGGKTTHRSIQVDGTEWSSARGSLICTRNCTSTCWPETGFGIDQARPAIELAYRIRTAALEPAAEPTLSGVRR